MSSTESTVTFHTGVLAPVDYMLRLVRKSLSLNMGLVVVAPDAVAGAVDEQLWVSEPGSFVPHIRWERCNSATQRARSPVWILSAGAGEPVELPPGRQAVVNFGAGIPLAPTGYHRVIELVGADEAHRRIGQQRWRLYRERGISPAHHAVS